VENTEVKIFFFSSKCLSEGISFSFLLLKMRIEVGMLFWSLVWQVLVRINLNAAGPVTIKLSNLNCIKCIETLKPCYVHAQEN